MRRIGADPIAPLLRLLESDRLSILSTDVSRYREAYWFYYLAMRRILENMSVTARHQTSVIDARGRGGRVPYTTSQRKLAAKYCVSRPFLEFDMANSLIHARILLDRAIALSRAFLKDSPVPSFTSFHDHKKFFLARRGSFTSHKEYGDYICDQTSWFDVRLKAVRDKFFVHASPRHMRFMGLPNSHQVDLVIMLPAGENPDKPLERMKTIRVNALALSYEIDGFLVWLSAYGVAHSAPNKALQGARNSKRSVAVARP